jgi:hypothetical protein
LIRGFEELFLHVEGSEMRLITPYTGWRLNCYAAALGMLMSRRGDPRPTHFIDCLTTLPFGPFAYYRKFDFAVMGGLNPESGLDFATGLLGYECSISFGDSEREAVEKLKANLKTNWVLIGPVDMGYLTYDPFCKKKTGADHYVAGVDFDGDFVWINDHEGFVEVPLPWKDFLKAWKAERIHYKRGAYTQRALGKKTKELPDGEIFKSVLQKALSIVKGEHTQPEAIYGEKAIRTFADDLKKNGRVPVLTLTFVLPVCNQRCYDSAMFLAQEEFTNEALREASRLRMAQMRLFSKCRLFGNKKDIDAVHVTLHRIADIDMQYTKMLIKGTEML